MYWLIDNPGVVYLVLGLVAVAFFVAFRLRGRALHLGLAGGCLALMGLFWLLSQWVVTDRKQIAGNVRVMADAVVHQDADRLFRYVAPDFRFQNMDRDALYQRVKHQIAAHQIKNIHVWDFEFEEVSRPQRRAKVNFKARVDAPDSTYLFLLKTDFTLDGDTWKIRGMKLYNPVVNQDQPIDIPAH